MAASTTIPKSSTAIDAFVRLIRAHAAVTGRLSAQLSADHGLSINAYEALLFLARAPDSRMRRVDLAGQLLLTAGGVTRLLQGLERDGFRAPRRGPEGRHRRTRGVLEGSPRHLRGTDRGRPRQAARGLEVSHEADPRAPGRSVRR